MKIAVTSKDGDRIDFYHQHPDFIYIYDVREENLISAEKRKISGDRHGNKLSGSSFESVYEIIKDCTLFITRKMDPIPFQRFNSLGIRVKQAEGKIGSILGL